MLDTVTFFETAAARFIGATVEFFDPPMCCPTGLCGPTLDQTLLDVSEMIMALKAEGATVERYQIASHPTKFTGNPAVMKLVQEKQLAALPITLINGQIIKTGAYPRLDEVTTVLE
jgi:hypothetical protein